MVVTEVTGTHRRFIRECSRTEPRSREGESGLAAEVGAQTRGGGGRGANLEDGKPGQDPSPGPSPGIEEDLPGPDLGPGRGEGPEEEEQGQGPGPDRVTGEGGEDIVHDLAGAEV